MHLAEMERSGRGAKTRYIATLTDDSGASGYELVIAGPGELVKKIFNKSDFEATISPKATRKDAEAAFEATWKKYGKPFADLTRVQNISGLIKKEPGKITPDNSVLVSVSRTRGEGTFWGFWLPVLFVPQGENLLFALPPVCVCFGQLDPSSGDPDLFLTLNGVSTPTVRASVGGGLARDSVSFGNFLCAPWEQFVPFFRIYGYLASTFGIWIGGHGIP